MKNAIFHSTISLIGAGIEKVVRRLRDNENVEIFSFDRICTVLNCDLDDIVEYVPNNLISLRMQKQPKATSHPAHLHQNNWVLRLPQYKPYIKLHVSPAH